MSFNGLAWWIKNQNITEQLIDQHKDLLMVCIDFDEKNVPYIILGNESGDISPNYPKYIDGLSVKVIQTEKGTKSLQPLF